MTPKNFANLVGSWEGTKRLIMSPEDPVRDSNAVASIGLEANGKFLRVNYEWSFDDERQEGLLIIHLGKEQSAKSVWIDSFHQGGDFFVSNGSIENGKISTKAHYTQPEYSDWAWRICLETDDENSFSLTMFNIFPDGKEALAVDAKFKRRV